MLGILLHAPRGPFYSPKAARSRGEQSGKAILAFCRLAHWTVRCGSPSLFGEADRCRFLAVGAPDTVRCTPDSLVPHSDRWLCHASRADYAADRWPTGQSGAPPDSLVIHSRTPLIASREQPVDSRQPGAPDTVRCTTGQSGAPRPSCLWLNKAISFPI